MRVLIVDDEIVIRNGIANVLPWREHDYVILPPAASGEEAVIRIEKEKPDIIITDIKMYSMCGLELVKAIVKFPYPKEVIMLTGYDEFEYVQEAIKQNVSDYLLKTSSPEEILHSVNKARNRLQETKRFLALEESKTEQLINKQLKLLLYKSLPKSMADNLTELIPELGGSSLQLFVINTVVNDEENFNHKELWNTYLYGKWLIHNGKTLIIVPRQPNLSDDYLLQMAVKQISKKYNEPLQKSKVISSINNLSYAYEPTVSLALYKWFMPNENIISADKVKKRAGISYLDKYKYFEGKLLEYIRYGDEVNVTLLMNEFITWAFEHPMATPHSFERYIQNLYFSAVRYIAQISNQADKSKELKITEEYYSNPIETLTNLFTSLIIHINQSESGATKYVIDATQYIQEHLNDLITLQDVATHVHIHPNYLSEIIRKVTGKPYLELLTDMRMERAEHYIVNTQLKISEVTQLVGYNDRKHFTKVFKRYFKMTPSEYRKHINNEKNK